MGGTREVWMAASALSLLFASQSQANGKATKAGVAGFVRSGVDGVVDGRMQRLRIGDTVFSNQKIVTDGQGRVQLLLRDRGAITIGPNSEVSIDKYVYDEEQSTGEMIVSTAKGLARFVGGLLSKRRPVQVRTRIGTIGIRGAIVIVQHLPSGGLNVVFLHGDLAEWTSVDGASESVSRPGYSIPVAPDGSPGAPVQLSPADVAALVGQLEGSGPPVEIADIVSEALGVSAQVLDIELSDTPLYQYDLLEDEQGTRQADQDLTNPFLEGAGTGGL